MHPAAAAAPAATEYGIPELASLLDGHAMLLLARYSFPFRSFRPRIESNPIES